jgi:hypothetical protein
MPGMTAVGIVGLLLRNFWSNPLYSFSSLIPDLYYLVLPNGGGLKLTLAKLLTAGFVWS